MKSAAALTFILVKSVKEETSDQTLQDSVSDYNEETKIVLLKLLLLSRAALQCALVSALQRSEPAVSVHLPLPLSTPLPL